MLSLISFAVKVLLLRVQVAFFSNFANFEDIYFGIMEYYELPTLILFDNKNEKNEYLGENKIKKVPNWDQTMHQKENYASNSRPRPFTLFCRVIC